MATLVITVIVFGILAIELAVMLIGRRRFAAPPPRAAPHDGRAKARRR
jgi:hypothetical protein